MKLNETKNLSSLKFNSPFFSAGPTKEKKIAGLTLNGISFPTKMYIKFAPNLDQKEQIRH